MNVENLRKLSREQLVELAGQHGINVHWNAKEETIIRNIVETVLNPMKPAQKSSEMLHVAELPKAPVHDNKPADVEIAIAKIKEAKPDFFSQYDLEENTWYFKYRGAEESGNLAIQMRIIKERAMEVARGRRALMGRPEFELTNATGKNAYTNVVLA